MADNHLRRLLVAPIPVDRVALRVVLPARPEDVWLPRPKVGGHVVHSSTPLAIARAPEQSPTHVIGRKRGSMTVLGYAADQQGRSKKKSAAWVVRCDCGNYEHRTSVLRWLGTLADDCCAECRTRQYKIGKRFDPKPAIRATVAAHVQGSGEAP